MKVASRMRLFVALLVCAVSVIAQTRTPSILGLLTSDEFRNAGLSKLTPAELKALDASIMRITLLLATSAGAGVRGQSVDHPSSDTEFFDSRGAAVAFFDDDQTLYLWSGKPVAYLDEDSIFGFNGKHLGWLAMGSIYDHDGNLVAAIADRFASPVKSPPSKGFKEFKPFKAFEEFKPFKPFFSNNWSDVPARLYLSFGAD
jgi:hypothetical protein